MTAPARRQDPETLSDTRDVAVPATFLYDDAGGIGRAARGERAGKNHPNEPVVPGIVDREQAFVDNALERAGQGPHRAEGFAPAPKRAKLHAITRFAGKFPGGVRRRGSGGDTWGRARRGGRRRLGGAWRPDLRRWLRPRWLPQSGFFDGCLIGRLRRRSGNGRRCAGRGGRRGPVGWRNADPLPRRRRVELLVLARDRFRRMVGVLPVGNQAFRHRSADFGSVRRLGSGGRRSRVRGLGRLAPAASAEQHRQREKASRDGDLSAQSGLLHENRPIRFRYVPIPIPSC